MFAAKDTLLTRPSGGYTIARSVRLRSSASAYFSRTPATTTNRRTWTFSCWIKQSVGNSFRSIFGSGTTSTPGNYGTFAITASNQLDLEVWAGAVFTTNAVFRDPSAWYHIVLAVDTNQATSSNRVKLYVNGVQITSFAVDSVSSYYTIGYDTAFNQNQQTTIGSLLPYAGLHLDAYMTEVNWIDGQQLTPSSFGETNAVTGVWQPKAYTGTYGTNGFYLNFSDNSAVTTSSNVGIGKDFSGNGNYWTSNSINVTAYSGTPPNNVSYDSMVDVPTLYADGGNGRGNYAVLNPLENVNTTYMGFQNVNLRANMGTGAVTGCWSSMVFPSGKFYFETTITTVSNGTIVGISYGSNTYADGSSKCISYTFNGDKNVLGTSTAYGATYTTGDVIGVAVDTAAGTVTFYKNNASQGVITNASILAESYRAWLQNATSGQSSLIDINFGQRPFSYTPPTGFVALNTQNLPAPTISNGAGYMAATTYTGTGASLTIANTVGSASFQPDLVWVKGRSGATDHAWYDAVRGVQKQLESNNTAAETTETTGLTAFGSTGFTVGALAQMNTNTATYVAWQWSAGGSTVTNTSGSISAQVRANTTAGFSVVTYTGTGANATVGHGLGVTPSMVIVKARSTTGNWCVTTTALGANNVPFLDLTNAAASFPTIFNGLPTSTIFNIGTAGSTNTNAATFVAYCFAAVAGYSAFGSYTGNGSTDGTFVYTGFRPRFLLTRRTDSAAGWIILDSARSPNNVAQNILEAQSSGADTGSTYNVVDFLSNGFKFRITGDPNTSGAPNIYMAFAENPFKYSLAR